MKVLLIYDQHLHYGGPKVYLDQIVLSLSQMKGFEVDLLGFNSNQISSNLKVYRLIKSRLKKFKPDIVHFQEITRFTNTVYLACVGYKKIKTLHGYSSLLNTNGYVTFKRHHSSNNNKLLNQSFVIGNLNIKKLHKIIEKFFLSSILLITPGLEHRKYLKERGFKSVYLPMFSEIEKRLNQEKKLNDHIIFVGRLKHEKGLHILIEAIKYLKTSCKLTVVGDGPDRYYQETLASSNVKFVGEISRNKIAEYYESHSVLIFPSIYPENNPLTIIEAIHSGLPVVGSNVPGVSELVRENESGLLFEPGNPTDLAQKIDQILANKQLYEKLSLNSFKKSKNYTLEKHIKGLIKIYEDSI